jgi:2,4-dienoyl-CoA reductase-like NADH-dependent reductase (Old Yellow Enzyme family)
MELKNRFLHSALVTGGMNTDGSFADAPSSSFIQSADGDVSTMITRMGTVDSKVAAGVPMEPMFSFTSDNLVYAQSEAVGAIHEHDASIIAQLVDFGMPLETASDPPKLRTNMVPPSSLRKLKVISRFLVKPPRV